MTPDVLKSKMFSRSKESRNNSVSMVAIEFTNRQAKDIAADLTLPTAEKDKALRLNIHQEKKAQASEGCKDAYLITSKHKKTNSDHLDHEKIVSILLLLTEIILIHTAERWTIKI